jgi:RimJ/RimL family protein N-acetyltransferase
VDGSPETSNREELAWHGPRVRLRAFEASDWAAYANWDDDADQARNLDAIHFPRSDENTQRWAEELASRPRDGDNMHFVIEDERGEVVGNLNTHRCDARVGTFSYGISIRRDRRGKGYAKEAILLVLRHYFDELRYQKVTVGVYAFNEPSIRLHEKLGFRLEGRLRRMTFTRGEHFDELLYGLTVEEFAERIRQDDVDSQ